MSGIAKSRKTTNVLSILIALAIFFVMVVYVFPVEHNVIPVEQNAGSTGNQPGDQANSISGHSQKQTESGYGVIAVPEGDSSLPDVFSTSPVGTSATNNPFVQEQAVQDTQTQAEGEGRQIPPEFTKAMQHVPNELPDDLKAQLEGPPPEIPEDIKRALQIPPRVVSLEEVNNPNFKPGDEKPGEERMQPIWPQAIATPEGWGFEQPVAVATPEIVYDYEDLENDSDE